MSARQIYRVPYIERTVDRDTYTWCVHFTDFQLSATTKLFHLTITTIYSKTVIFISDTGSEFRNKEAYQAINCSAYIFWSEEITF